MVNGRKKAPEPRPTDQVLVDEFRSIEALMREKQPDRAGVVSCNLMEELTRWEVGLRFHKGSRLQEMLDEYGEFVGEKDTRNKLVLRIYFPLDYPKCPPEVMIHEPRMAPSAHIVTFNGKVCSPLLGDQWSERGKATDIVKDTLIRLASSELADKAQWVRPYEGKLEHGKNVALRPTDFPTIGNFAKEVYVLSCSQARQEYGAAVVDNISGSDRISLPTAFMGELYNDNMQLPIMFEIRTYEGRVRNMSISESQPFIEYLPADKIIVPDWVHKDLAITPTWTVTLRCVSLPSIKSLVLQPHCKTFYDDIAKTMHGNSQQAALNYSMKYSKLTAVTVNSGIQLIIPTVRENDKVQMLEVIDVTPGGAVSLIGSADQWDIEFKVDFRPAPDFEDEDDRNKRLAAKQAIHDKKVLAAEKIKTEKEQKRTEAKITQALAERLQLADETPNVGKVGEVDIRLTCPGGENFDGKFKEGTKVKSIVSFIMINSKWAEDEAVLAQEVKLSTAFPKATWSNDDVITKRGHHRQRVLVTKGEEAELEEDDEPMHEGPMDPHDELTQDLFPRATTSALHSAWEATQENVAQRAQMRQEHDAETARIVENAAKRPRQEAPTGGSMGADMGDFDMPPQDAGDNFDAQYTDEQLGKIEQILMIIPDADPVMVRQMLETCNWDPDQATMLLMGA